MPFTLDPTVSVTLAAMTGGQPQPKLAVCSASTHGMSG